MKKVGFFLNPTLNWMGGINYYKNLFKAINKINSTDVRLILFLGYKTNKSVIDILSAKGKNVEVVLTTMLDKGSLYWIVWKLIRKIFRSDLAVIPLCLIHGIEVVSHSNFTNIPFIKSINWIPDLQHIHLTKIFSEEEIRSRDLRHNRLIKGSNKIIVNSIDTASDLVKMYPNVKSKIYILGFMSFTPDFNWETEEKNLNNLLEKYQIKSNYFYVPNQFWEHKNHAILIDAVDILRSKGVNVQIVCSGAMSDYRNPCYFEQLKQSMIKRNCLEFFAFLGTIPHNDVFKLIRFSIATINPSRFEGWSTTVEECKSMGKRMILSDIAVHREQMPEALFFTLENSNLLAVHMENMLFDKSYKKGIDYIILLNKNEKRAKEFAEKYIELVESI